jgi:hypothetical protein
MNTVYNERRKYPRFRMNKDVLSINQDILAEVLDISNCGMLGRCLTSTAKPLTAITEIDILNCELGISIEGLPCRMVRSSKKTISDALTSTMIMNFSIEFQFLTNNQLFKLDQFIKNNHLGEAKVSQY